VLLKWKTEHANWRYDLAIDSGENMSTVLILTPIIIANWPAITAAAASAAAALGLSVKDAAKDLSQTKTAVSSKAEIEIAESNALAESVAANQELVLTKGTIQIKVCRNQRGRISVCAEGTGHSDSELKAAAEEFGQKLAQSFVYNKVMSELRTKGFQVVNEEQLEDESVSIHVRRWEG
jgi:hypothetical protein